MTTRRAFIAGSLATATVLKSIHPQAQTSDLCDLTLAEASKLIRNRLISPTELVQAYLQRIELLQPKVNAYITVTDEMALMQAQRLEQELNQGRWRGPLHGIPIALKDNIDTAGIRTTAASALLQDRIPERDAPIYQKLLEAGAILLGKLNMHEFAWGGTSAITHYRPVHNPWNLGHIPGGSSGGSAAAVAARMCCAALGTDTLASIRLPAAYCGVVGLKATHGLTSIRGIIPVAESLDHVGPICRTVADSALMMQAMAGFDLQDPHSIQAPAVDYAATLSRPTTDLKIGIPREIYYDALHPDVERALTEALAVLSSLTADAREVNLPEPPNFAPLLAESYAWHQPYLSDTSNHSAYDPVTLERLLAAGNVSTADYIRTRHDMMRVRHRIAEVFKEVDILVTPTAATLPEEIAHAINPAEASGAEPSVRNTAPFNLYGIPTVSIPCGFSDSDLPIGMQLSSAHLREDQLFALAHAYQREIDWHLRMPSVAG